MPSERLAPLLAQLDTSWQELRERLDGMTDDEFVWEPAPGAFAVRRDGDAWAHDRERGPAVGSVRTIAWLAGHVGSGCLLRAEYTVGDHLLADDDLVWPGTAAEGVAFMEEGIRAWRDGLGQMTDEDAATIGRSQYPGGLDRDLPLIDIVWWQNRELIHHGAEMACLRDLYGALATPPPSETPMGDAHTSGIRETVDRMERRLAADDDERTARLMAAYERLIPRFEADLGDERDVLLSRGAALMLVREAARRR